MKKMIILVLFISAFISCDENNTSPVSVELTPFIIENYSSDARQLYFNEVFNNKNSSDYNNPELNMNQEKEILEIIQAVYNLQSLERDTVFTYYKIHGYYCYNFNAVNLKVNPDLPAIKKLAEGVIPTGDAALDKILSTYGFDAVDLSYGYPGFPWLTVTTPKEYNMIPAEKEFEKLKSVLTAEFNKGCIGDGNSISLKREGKTATITFSIGEGDCPAGCIYHRYWEFRVTNGLAQFIKSYER